MEVKEAADLLDNLIGMIEDSGGRDYDTALKMGIEALTSKPTDCIGRQAAIDAAIEAINEWGGGWDAERETRDAINALPSAQSEIIRCGECTHKDKKIDYCHYLGITICERDFCSYAERETDG